ncbi:hypothetical protein [Bacillus sp. SDLI1]|uniref:hypothetical protein n=1 Tax=Bacillus sp. SDLI1 TaxID=1774743 RepID=UPI0007684E1F|nr:hypothetical protein [Bacillus sp. SDLI1]AME04839.1 hypothetical protein AUL54_00125 [Bacillus sp. SDLI1]
MFKKIAVGSLVLTSLVGIGFNENTSTVKAAEKPAIKPVEPVMSVLQKKIDRSFTITGDDSIHFDYWGSEDRIIQVYLKNTGSRTFNYNIISPTGSTISSGASLSPGQQMTLPFSAQYDGTYRIRIFNTIGATVQGWVSVAYY